MRTHAFLSSGWLRASAWLLFILCHVIICDAQTVTEVPQTLVIRNVGTVQVVAGCGDRRSARSRGKMKTACIPRPKRADPTGG